MPLGGRREGAGRKPGSKNRRTQEVEAKLKSAGCDPVTALAEIATEAYIDGDLKLAADCYKSLLPYVAPKLGSVEVTAALGHEIRVVEIATGIGGVPGGAIECSEPIAIEAGTLDDDDSLGLDDLDDL